MTPLVPTAFNLVLIAALALYLGIRHLRRRKPATVLWLALPAGLIYALILAFQPRAWPLVDGVVLAVALTAEALIGALLRSLPALVSFCLVAAIVDTISSSGGLTRQISEAYRSGGSELLLYLSLSVPVGGALRPIVGIGDLVVLSALFRGLAALGSSALATFVGPASGLMLALGVALWAGRGVPALPFMAAATILTLLLPRILRSRREATK